ncbi:MAG: hypothetical protein ACK5X3_16065 [Pseudomonadota bacterium]
MEIVPYAREHLLALRVQPAQADAAPWITPDYAASLEGGTSWTVLANCRPVFCGGSWELWPGRALVWAILSPEAGPHMARITRGVRRYLGLLPHRRVECYVDAGFEQGARWAAMLGFEREATLRAFLPNGNDAHIYARVR